MDVESRLHILNYKTAFLTISRPSIHPSYGSATLTRRTGSELRDLLSSLPNSTFEDKLSELYLCTYRQLKF